MGRKKEERPAPTGGRPGGEVVELSLGEVSVDGGTQTRADGTVPIVVEEYAELLRAGVELPPVEVVSGNSHWLWDGFHRYQAHRLADRKTIRCRITPGTLADARWLALSANKAHGLRRSNADKRRAVELALAMRPEMSDRAIAEHCGVDHKTVAGCRQQLGNFPSCDPEKRVGKDGKARSLPAPKQDPVDIDDDPFADVPDEGVADDGDGPPDEGLESHPKDVPGVERDEVGLAIPDAAAEAFAARAEFDRLVADLRRIAQAIGRLAAGPGGAELRKQLLRKGRTDDGIRFSCEHVQNAVYKLKHCRPHASACPHCEHDHPGKVDVKCPVCNGVGWTCASAWESSPGDYRRYVELSRRAREEGHR